MTTFSYIVRTADPDQLDQLSFLQQVLDLSLYEESKRPEDEWVYTNQEFLAVAAFVRGLGDAMSDRFHDLGPYWDDDPEWRETPEDEYQRIHHWHNRPLTGDLWVCTDLFEGYDGDDSIPF